MSKVFFISYDIRFGTTIDYKQIEKILYEINAQRVLNNLWVYEGDLYLNTENVRDALLPHFKLNDRLLVIEAKEWAWYNAM